MKKILILLVTLLAVCMEVKAQKLTVDEVEALPGETVVFTISLDTNGGSYTGMEFDILFSQSGFTTTGQATTAAGWDGAFTIGSVGGVGIENLARAGVLSYSDTEIPGNGSNELGFVEINVGNNIPLGYYTVTLTNVTLIGASRVPVSNATFTLHVVDHHTIVLDEKSTTAPESAQNVDVIVKRTINANEWSTICLPFAMEKEQVEAAFGELGTKVWLADFTGVETTEKDGDIVGLSLNFVKTDEIEANHPYLIKVSEAVSSFTVDGVDIAPEDEPSVDQDKTKIGKFYFYNRFVGTYEANTIVPNLSLFLNGNKFYYSSGATKMKAFRGYFDFYDVLTEVEDATATSRIFLSFDNETTSIGEIGAPNVLQGGVYNLNGQFMGADVDLKSLPKGIYVVDGKKVVNY